MVPFMYVLGLETYRQREEKEKEERARKVARFIQLVVKSRLSMRLGVVLKRCLPAPHMRSFIPFIPLCLLHL